MSRAARVAGIGRAPDWLLAAVALCAVVWLTWFRLSAGFGFYEDDYYRVVMTLDMTAGEVAGYLWLLVEEFQGRMGRPLHDGLIASFSWLGFRIAGKTGLFVLAASVLAVNGLLFYSLLRRAWGRWAAMAGALALVVFPADSTRPFLTHAFGVQPALTFLLVALHGYLRRRWWLAYPAAAGTLVSYETVFPLFLAAPLLGRRWNARSALFHGMGALAVLAAIISLRWLTGEGRLAGIQALETASHVAHNVLAGPVTALRESVSRAGHGLRDGLLQDPILLALITLGSCWLLVRGGFAAEARRRRLGVLRWRAARLVLAGAVMLPLSYPFALTVSAEATSGRATRVHAPAAVGFGLMAAGLCLAAAGAGGGRWRRGIATTIPALLLAGCVAAGVAVQRDYRDAWSRQQRVWTSVVRLCPDAGPGTLILIDASVVPGTREAVVLGWNLVDIPKRLFRFPPEQQLPPVAAILRADWRHHLDQGASLVSLADWQGMETAFAESYANAEVIWLTGADGGFARVETLGKPAAGNAGLKAPGPPRMATLPRRPLYDLLILPEPR